MEVVLEFLKILILCFAGNYCVAYLLDAPKGSFVIGALIGSFTYLIYLLMCKILPDASAYFVSAFFMTLCSEIAAKVKRMPATVFLFIAILPLVPGSGLFYTMMYMIQGKLDAFFKTGISTLINIGAMALAIAVASFIMRYIVTKILILKHVKQTLKEEGELYD